MKNNLIIKEARAVLLQLVEMMNQLNYDEYTQKLDLLSYGSIGEHIRHIIELFQQLYKGCDSGYIDYDQRQRDLRIQENMDYATECIGHIISKLERSNTELILTGSYNSIEHPVHTNYYRELLYNIEHCIHHQAIIKMALLHMGKFFVDDQFGVAKSTINYRKENVHS